MTVKDVQLLFEYNWWATGRVLEAVSVLGKEQLTRDLSTSYSSIHGTLVHTLGAEWIWLMRANGTSPKQLFEAAEFPTLESLRAKWGEVKNGYDELVAGLTDDSLEKVISYTNTKGERWEYPLGQIMQHVTNHSSYHRGQVTTMLRQLGAKAVTTDFLVYIDVKNDTNSR